MEFVSPFAWKLMKRVRIDPEGVRSELDSALQDNLNFKDNLRSLGDNMFFHEETGQVFKITENENGRRMTRILPPKEIEEILKNSPKLA